MAILTFQCLGCNSKFDEIVRGEEEKEVKCRKCGGDQLSRLPTYSAAPRGDFGSTRRNASGEASQEFNFLNPKKDE